MFPYKPEDVFKISKNIEPEVFTLGDTGNVVVTIDNFYEDPDTIRDIILNTPYPIWKHNENSRNFIDYYDCRQFFSVPYEQPLNLIKYIAKEIMGIEILNTDIEFITNLFKLINDQPFLSQPHPHDDGIRLASLVTFNTDEECSGGTAFYKSISPPFEHMSPDPAEYEKISNQVYSADKEWEDGTNYFSQSYAKDWELIEVVEAKYNRLLIYPGIYFHGAWHEHNAFKEHFRVNQVMFFENVQYPDV